jgi:hypothetical protein
MSSIQVYDTVISEGTCICTCCCDIFQADEICSWTPATWNIPEYSSIGAFDQYEATNAGDPPRRHEFHESSSQDILAATRQEPKSTTKRVGDVKN